MPSDGTWIAFDCIAILKESDPRQKEIAEDFINFLFHPTVSAALANFSMKASTNEAARAFLNSDIKFGPSYMQPTGKWEPLLVDPDDAIPEQVYQLIAPETPAAPNTL